MPLDQGKHIRHCGTSFRKGSTKLQPHPTRSRFVFHTSLKSPRSVVTVNVSLSVPFIRNKPSKPWSRYQRIESMNDSESGQNLGLWFLWNAFESPEVLAANCPVNEPGMKQWDLQLRQGHGVLKLLFHGAEYAKELTVFKLRPLTAGNLLQWLAFSKSPNYSIE